MSIYSEQAGIERQHLLRFALRVIDGPDPATAVAADRELINRITPASLITLVDDLVRQEIPIERLKPGVNKLIHLFNRSLSAQTSSLPEQYPLLNTMRQNNHQAESALSALRPLLTRLVRKPDDIALLSDIRKQLLVLKRFTAHYTIKENAVFPLLEKRWPDFRCLAVMWSVHDDIRRHLKETLTILSEAERNQKQFNKIIGRIFFDLSAVIFREEKILFPHMLATLEAADWQEMLEQSLALDWPFEPPQATSLGMSAVEAHEPPLQEETFNLGSGRLNREQLNLLLNHLPMDLTLVDENDRVIYFSEGNERIFPRSRAIIGRLVQNCHPPESVAVVEEIIRSFRSGKENTAEFWIDLPQGKVLIRYLALRDADDTYRGVLEISQLISPLQTIKGERRLLSWRKQTSS